MNKKIYSVIALLSLFYCLLPSLIGQGLIVDSLGYETFEMVEEDTSYLMKKYYMVSLIAGDNRDHSDDEAATIQEGHMNHMNWLAEEGYLCMAGPMAESGPTRGIMIMSVPTIEKAIELTSKDPAVLAGRLKVEIEAFWAAVGSKLH